VSPHEFEDDPLGKAYDWRLIRRFLGYLRPYLPWVALTFGLIVAAAGLEVAVPILLQRSLDDMVAEAPARPLWFWGALFLGAIFVRGLLHVSYSWLTNSTGQRVLRDLRVSLFRHILRQPVPFFDRNPTGRLLVRVTNDIENLNELFASGIVELFADLLMLTGVLAVMFWISPSLTLIALTVAPLIGGVLILFRVFARRKYREIRRKIARMNAYLAECIQGMRVVKAFARQRYCRDRFGAMNDDLCRETIGNVLLHSFIMPAMELLGAVITALILWHGGARIFEGTMTFGAFLAFWYCARRVIEPLRDLSEKYNILQSAMASSERVFKILDAEPESRAVAAGPRVRTPGAVEFDKVSFSYDGRTPVLQEISFSIPPGGHVALVGATGSGKTTLVHLLLGFYPVTRGSIRVDGRDVRDYDPVDLRRRFGMVGQDLFLFSGSIEENIRLGDRQVPYEQVLASARAVGLHRIVERFPRGFATDVRERGLSLSAGERQLISLARAFCVDSSIVILDEATSYVDMHTDAVVQQAAERVLRSRTAFVVAHRLATIRTLERILVLHRGRIVEDGTHPELRARGGIYSRLCRIQFESAVRT
jgi:ATP-binding cassette subfamily B multidrug efflux pump